MKSLFFQERQVKDFINNSSANLISAMLDSGSRPVKRVPDDRLYNEGANPSTRNAAIALKRRHQTTRGKKAISDLMKIADQRKKEATKVFTTKKVNYNDLASVKIDKRTTILINKKKNPEEARQLFLFHNDLNQSI